MKYLAYTAKRLRNKAQGCRASRLPWGYREVPSNPIRGCVLSAIIREADATPVGVVVSPNLISQGSREARQPWASLRNRFAVKTTTRLLVLLVAFALCGIGAVAQKRASSDDADEAPSSYQIRARSGDTIPRIAERHSVSADELARINQLQVDAKLRKGQRLRVPTAETTSETGDSNPTEGQKVVGKRIKFTDGGTLTVDEAWQQGSVVWFKRGSFTQSSDRQVKSIEPVYAARDKEALKPVDARPGKLETPAPAEVATWIYLVGGARFKVDAVNETTDGAWYNRGNLSIFLARDRIDHIERDQPDSPGPEGPLTDWTSGSPNIDRLIRTNGTRFGIDPYLVFLVIEQESHFRPTVVSPKGARGLMQLMPGTARRFGVKRPFDPAENIRGGTQYLKQLLVMFGGRVDLALASYNAGEGRVIEYGHKVPPFRETREYVKRISRRYGKKISPRKDVRKAPVKTTAGE